MIGGDVKAIKSAQKTFHSSDSVLGSISDAGSSMLAQANDAECSLIGGRFKFEPPKNEAKIIQEINYGLTREKTLTLYTPKQQAGANAALTRIEEAIQSKSGLHHLDKYQTTAA